MTALQADRSPTVPAAMARSWRLVAAEQLARTDPLELAASDVVVVDLEAGTPEDRKAAARDALVAHLATGHRVWVRVNGTDTAHWRADMDLVAAHDHVDGVVLAMTEDGDQVRATRDAAGVPVVAMVETALSILRLPEIAASGTTRIAFGTGDFRKDLGVGPDRTALLYARSQLVIASRAHRLPGPIDGPTVADDADQARSDTEHARTLGMTGRICLTATHTAVVNEVCAPTPADVVAARDLIDAPPEGYAGALGPRLAHARSVLHRADVYGIEG